MPDALEVVEPAPGYPRRDCFPGGGGRKRFGLPRSVAVLDLAPDGVQAKIVDLAPP